MRAGGGAQLLPRRLRDREEVAGKALQPAPRKALADARAWRGDERADRLHRHRYRRPHAEGCLMPETPEDAALVEAMYGRPNEKGEK